MTEKVKVTRADVLMNGLGAALVVTGTALWYAKTIHDQGDTLTAPTPLFLLSSLAIVVVLLVGGSLSESRAPSAFLLSLATGALLILGLIGLFSIGIFLLMAGALGSLATVSSVRRRGGGVMIALVAAAASIALVLAIFAAVARAD